jgi:hypothetical protein
MHCALTLCMCSWVQLRRGFVAVVNRSQKDIKENVPMEEARAQVQACVCARDHPYWSPAQSVAFVLALLLQ